MQYTVYRENKESRTNPQINSNLDNRQPTGGTDLFKRKQSKSATLIENILKVTLL